MKCTNATCREEVAALYPGDLCRRCFLADLYERQIEKMRRQEDRKKSAASKVKILPPATFTERRAFQKKKRALKKQRMERRGRSRVVVNGVSCGAGDCDN